MTSTRTSTSDLLTDGTICRKQKQADLTSMSLSAQTYPSWLKTTQWAVEVAGATKETATVVAMEAVEATVEAVAALAIVVAVAAVEAVVEAAGAIMTTTIVVVAEAAGEAKATMDGVAVIWEVVAGDLEAETTRSSSQQTSAMHLAVAAVATVEATIAVTQAWRSALPLSITTEVVVVEEAIAVAEVDLVTAVDGEAATATRRCTVSRLAAEANRSSKSHAATAKLFTLVI